MSTFVDTSQCDKNKYTMYPFFLRHSSQRTITEYTLFIYDPLEEWKNVPNVLLGLSSSFNSVVEECYVYCTLKGNFYFLFFNF